MPATSPNKGPIQRGRKERETDRPTSLRSVCREFVDRLASRSEVSYAAMWVRSGFLHRSPGSGYELVRANPEGRTVRMLHQEHELSEWCESALPFAWRAAEQPPTGILNRRRAGGVFLFFARDQRLILCINVQENSVEVDGIQTALAQLSERLDTHVSHVLASDEAPCVTVDLGFLEAMALGDEVFVRHMLDLCVTQLEEGSEQMAVALRDKITDQVAYYAHKLRSTARTAGADQLDALLELAEKDAQSGHLGRVLPAVHGCEQAITALNRILAD